MNLGGIFHVRGSSQAVNRSMAARVTQWHPKRQNHTASPSSSWTMPIYSLPACLEQECKHSLGFMCSSNLPVYPGQTLLLAGKAAWSWRQPETEMQVHLVPARAICCAFPSSQHPWAEQRLQWHSLRVLSVQGYCKEQVSVSQALTISRPWKMQYWKQLADSHAAVLLKKINYAKMTPSGCLGWAVV